MNESDPVRDLLVEFFQLPPATPASELAQSSVAQWDSLAMVQLIAELQSVFGVVFELDEIERLTSYAEIRAALARRGAVSL
jgi:acyl carrier protein